MSGAQWLSAGGIESVLINFAIISHTNGEPNPTYARILEVTHTTPAQRVFDLSLIDGEGGAIRVYRSTKIPSLYAEGIVVAPVN